MMTTIKVDLVRSHTDLEGEAKESPLRGMINTILRGFSREERRPRQESDTSM